MIKMYFIELIFFDFSDLQIWTGKKKKTSWRVGLHYTQYGVLDRPYTI